MGSYTFYDFVTRRFIPPDEVPGTDGITNYIVKSSIPILPEEADILHGLATQGLEVLLENISLDMGTF